MAFPAMHGRHYGHWRNPANPLGLATTHPSQAVTFIEQVVGQLESQLEKESTETRRLGSELEATKVSACAALLRCVGLTLPQHRAAAGAPASKSSS